MVTKLEEAKGLSRIQTSYTAAARRLGVPVTTLPLWALRSKGRRALFVG